MSLDTYQTISASILARCPVADVLLARQWTEYAFRIVAERRRWSWLTRYGQFIFPTISTAGSVSVIQGSTTVTGTGTAFTAAMVGQQFRPASTVPLYDIIAVNVGAQTLTLANPYGGYTNTTLGYQIYQAYQVAPSDYHAFITAVDPYNQWRLWINQLQTSDLDAIDPARAYTGNGPYTIVFHDYASATLMDALNLSGPPLPRYEFWPQVTINKVIPFMYETRATDISDSGAELPRYVRGDVLLEHCLGQAAAWPGPEGRPNPMFNLALADRHNLNFERMANELERQDDEVWEQNLTYNDWYQYRYAPFPLTANYLQSHAI